MCHSSSIFGESKKPVNNTSAINTEWVRERVRNYIRSIVEDGHSETIEWVSDSEQRHRLQQILRFMQIFLRLQYEQADRPLPCLTQEDYEWSGTTTEYWLCYDIDNEGWMIRWGYDGKNIYAQFSRPVHYIEMTVTINNPAPHIDLEVKIGNEQDQAVLEAMADPDV